MHTRNTSLCTFFMFNKMWRYLNVLLYQMHYFCFWHGFWFSEDAKNTATVTAWCWVSCVLMSNTIWTHKEKLPNPVRSTMFKSTFSSLKVNRKHSWTLTQLSIDAESTLNRMFGTFSVLFKLQSHGSTIASVGKGEIQAYYPTSQTMHTSDLSRLLKSWYAQVSWSAVWSLVSKATFRTVSHL